VIGRGATRNALSTRNSRASYRTIWRWPTISATGWTDQTIAQIGLDRIFRATYRPGMSPVVVVFDECPPRFHQFPAYPLDQNGKLVVDPTHAPPGNLGETFAKERILRAGSRAPVFCIDGAQAGPQIFFPFFSSGDVQVRGPAIVMWRFPRR